MPEVRENPPGDADYVVDKVTALGCSDRGRFSLSFGDDVTCRFGDGEEAESFTVQKLTTDGGNVQETEVGPTEMKMVFSDETSCSLTSGAKLGDRYSNDSFVANCSDK